MRPVVPLLLLSFAALAFTPNSIAASPPSHSTAARSYAALGASETYGVGASPRSKSYAYLVARGLHARQFVDLGIPGTTLNAAYQTELSNALAARPRLCTAFFGFNDLRAGVPRDAFLSDLHDLSVTLHRGNCRVLIIGLPDLSVVPAVRNTHLPGVKKIITSWNTGMRAVARQTGAHYLDLTRFSSELAHHPEYISGDGLHPSNVGYARIAQVVLATIHSKHLWT